MYYLNQTIDDNETSNEEVAMTTTTSDQSEIENKGKYGVLIMVEHEYWFRTWLCSRYMQYCLYLLVRISN